METGIGLAVNISSSSNKFLSLLVVPLRTTVGSTTSPRFYSLGSGWTFVFQTDDTLDFLPTYVGVVDLGCFTVEIASLGYEKLSL